MNSIFFALIFQAVRRIVTAELFLVILGLVQTQFSNSLSGPEKKAAVIEQLKILSGKLSTSVAGLPGWVLSMAVDIAVAELKKKQGL